MPPKRRDREQTDAVSPDMSAPKRQCSDERTLPGPTLLTAVKDQDQAATRDAPSAAGGSLSGARDATSATGTSLSGDPDPQLSEERLLDLAAMKCNVPNPEKKDLDAALRAARGVTRLLAVGEYEKSWLRQLLLRAADTVQELSVTCTDPGHLCAVYGMRELRKLELELPDEEWTRAPKVEWLKPPPVFANLEWLSVRTSVANNPQSLVERLSARSQMLETMQVVLVAGSEHDGVSCSELMYDIGRQWQGWADADSVNKVLCTACHGEEDEEHI